MSAEQNTRSTSRIRRIGFISTRIAGTDGVSLETEKWATVLKRLGYRCYYIDGELEKSGAHTYRIKEAAFTHPTIVDIQRQCFGVESRPRKLSKAIDDSLVRIKDELYRCQDKLKLDLWIAENCLALPMNIPLGLALAEFLAETGMPCLAHHHDFTWERERFATSAVSDYLHAAFPPKLPSVHHVVINSVAQSQLSYRLGVPATLIPNVMDFANPPPLPDAFSRGFRRDIGLQDNQWLILQPTRVVPRKKIELAVELVRRLEDPRAKLVVTHSVNDEGEAYPDYIRDYARLLDVPVLFTHEWVGERRSKHESSVGHKLYGIRDTYPHADLVTYPSEYEGFGNAFLEAIYFRKPIVCNRYSIYRTDIEPKGFDVVALPGFVTEESVEKARAILQDAHHCRKMVERNYALGEQFFSYAVLERKLAALLAEIAGISPQSR